MTRRRQRRACGPLIWPLNPLGQNGKRALHTARSGTDQAGISAKVAAAAGGSGQPIQNVDEIGILQRSRQLATVSATLKKERLLFRPLIYNADFESRNAATPATARARIWKPSFYMLRTTVRKALYARVRRCKCCSVAKLENRYIYQSLKKLSLQHALNGCRCSRCGTIKYPEISSSCLSGDRHG